MMCRGYKSKKNPNRTHHLSRITAIDNKFVAAWYYKPAYPSDRSTAALLRYLGNQPRARERNGNPEKYSSACMRAQESARWEVDAVGGPPRTTADAYIPWFNGHWGSFGDCRASMMELLPQ